MCYACCVCFRDEIFVHKNVYINELMVATSNHLVGVRAALEAGERDDQLAAATAGRTNGTRRKGKFGFCKSPAGRIQRRHSLRLHSLRGAPLSVQNDSWRESFRNIATDPVPVGGWQP
jgi:hypothetical protein